MGWGRISRTSDADRAGRRPAGRFRVSGRFSPRPAALLVGLALVTSSTLLALPSKKDLARLDAAIAAGDWAAALDSCEKQLGAIATDIAGPGPRAEQLAALPARCALAAAGAGDARAASWHWHVANILDAKTAAEVAASVGAGVSLPPIRPRIEVEQDPAGSAVDNSLLAPDGRPIDATPPERLSAPQPRIRPQPMKPMLIVIQVVIDTEGRVNEPRMVSARNCTPIQGYGVLRAMRTWRFKPAMQNATPVPVLYTLTTSARLN